MKQKHDLLGFILAIVAGLACLTALLCYTFFPRVILPRMDAITVIAIVLIALLLDHYAAHGSRRNYILIPIWGALIFGLFPLAACILAHPLHAINSGVLGAVIFPAATFLFDSMVDRLSDTRASKIAPLIGAFLLFLAAQCLMGIV